MPGLGHTVLYTLTQLDVACITQRRQLAELAAASAPPYVQAPWGEPVQPGDIYPATVVRVHSLDGPISLQVHLDGTDVHWVQRAEDGPDAGQWHWPDM